jgi:hypothetical protein
MKTVYLKRLVLGGIDGAVKLNGEHNLEVCNNQIQFDECAEYSIESETGWYKDKLDYQDATKDEFDTLFIETVATINELSKI